MRMSRRLYAVGGELYLRASELQKEGKKVVYFLLIELCFLVRLLNVNLMMVFSAADYLRQCWQPSRCGAEAPA